MQEQARLDRQARVRGSDVDKFVAIEQRIHSMFVWRAVKHLPIEWVSRPCKKTLH
jgi:hypothetical protein